MRHGTKNCTSEIHLVRSPKKESYRLKRKVSDCCCPLSSHSLALLLFVFPCCALSTLRLQALQVRDHSCFTFWRVPTICFRGCFTHLQKKIISNPWDRTAVIFYAAKPKGAVFETAEGLGEWAGRQGVFFPLDFHLEDDGVWFAAQHTWQQSRCHQHFPTRHLWHSFPCTQPAHRRNQGSKRHFIITPFKRGRGGFLNNLHCACLF